MDIVPKTFELIEFGKKHISRNQNSKFSIMLDDNNLEEKPRIEIWG